MQAVKQLTGTCSNKTIGNHRVEVVGRIHKLYYYATVICCVNETTKEFWVDNSYGTNSTNRACNAYRNELKRWFYREVNKDTVNFN